MEALASPSKRDSLDEGYDPNETLRCVVYEDDKGRKKKTKILRDSDIEEEEEEEVEGDDGRQMSQELGMDIESKLKSGGATAAAVGQKVGDYELVNYEQEPPPRSEPLEQVGSQ